MLSTDLYHEIAARTGGNIYIGVVGPVRTGKSSFIKKVMEHLILDQIDDPFIRQRAVDELPQASAGRTIMTTEPKFVPENAIQVDLGEHGSCNLRMVDCVGYVVDGALGQNEESGPRMVLTPWSEEEMPFRQAAEIGTKKVIREHSTISIMITTDGSIGDIPREEYLDAEKKVVAELKACGKPFVIVLNSIFTDGEHAELIRKSMEQEYGVPVVVKNCNELTSVDIEEILSSVLTEFPVVKIDVDLPSWVTYLGEDNEIKSELYRCLRSCAERYKVIRQMKEFCEDLTRNSYIDKAMVCSKELANGSVKVKIELPQALYFGMVSQILGKNISDEGDLILELRRLNEVGKKYDKIGNAFEIAKQSGYGIVCPERDDLVLERPERYHQSNRFGIRMKATAPTYHIIKSDIYSEIAPIIGDEEQADTLFDFFASNLEENMDKIWDYNIFGKTIYGMVNDGLQGKFERLPDDARCKLQETLSKILNEGSGGLICIIL